MNGDWQLKKYFLSYGQFLENSSAQLSTLTELSSAALIAMDFDNFNYINDLYGFEVGDRVLVKITGHIDEVLEERDFFCNPHSDHFYIFLHQGGEERAARVFNAVSDLKQILREIVPQYHTLVASGGIVLARDNSQSVFALLDQANYARKKAKGTSSNCCLVYDSLMRENARWRKAVTCMMDSSLEKREFEMYLQPKTILKTGQVIGAEALVRWKSAEYGLISPDRFIGIFEKNGFVQKLDFYMLEEACRFLADCRREGNPLLSVSVNFSQTHLGNASLASQIFTTVQKYEIPPSLIEIEFTESVVSETIEQLTTVVSELKRLGFGVSIDDFGNAYSSLSYLKNLPVDIIKIDKGFLQFGADIDRGKITLAKTVELIKSLRMIPVMEGVETENQASFLQKLGCSIAQGFLFARPMPRTDYLEYIHKNPVLVSKDSCVCRNDAEQSDKSYLRVIPGEFTMDNWELYMLGKNIDIGLMKGYIDSGATVQYVNDCALEYLGYSREEFLRVCNNSILSFTYPEDAELVKKNLQRLIETGKTVSFQTRAVRKDGKIIVLRGHASCVIDDCGCPVGLYSFKDVTEELEQAEALKRELEQKIERLEHTVALEKNAREVFLQNSFLLENIQGGIVYSDFNPPFHLRYATEGMAKLSGYTVEELAVMSQMELVHQDDVEPLAKEVDRQFALGDTFEVEYRLKRKDGSFCSVLDRAKVVTHNDGKKYIHCLLTDVTDLKDMEQLARLNQEKYKFVIQQSGNAILEYHIDTGEVSFSENYESLFGSGAPSGTLEELVQSSWVDRSFRESLSALFEKTVLFGVTNSLELQICPDGQKTLWCSLYLIPIKDEGRVYSVCGCLKNINRQKNEMEQLEALSLRDSLTGIYNRYAIEKIIKEHIGSASDIKKAALLILDIDNFKSINDEKGHSYGDKILIKLARVISRVLPKNAAFGRLGGDEFLLFYTFDGLPSDLENLCAKIIRAVTQELPPVTVSMGAAWQTKKCKSFTALYKNADSALYEIKKNRKNGYKIYAEPAGGTRL